MRHLRSMFTAAALIAASGCMVTAADARESADAGSMVFLEISDSRMDSDIQSHCLAPVDAGGEFLLNIGDMTIATGTMGSVVERWVPIYDVSRSVLAGVYLNRLDSSLVPSAYRTPYVLWTYQGIHRICLEARTRNTSTKAIAGTGGTISGTATAVATGLPVTEGWVSIYGATGSVLGLDFLDNAGEYSYGGLEPGTYYARTESTGFFDELWDDLPCAQGTCVVTSGTPIVVDAVVVTADFALDVGGTISGTVTATGTGLPITEGWVSIYEATGSVLGLDFLDNAGEYSYGGLEPGTYYARTESTGFFDELWDDIPCAQGNCVVTSGTEIVVDANLATANFALDVGGTISGTVTASGTGLPITDGWVSIYDATGSVLGLDFLDNAGGYSYGGLEPGTYYARTDSTGFFDELWDDIPCAQGNCVVISGTPIVVGTNVVTADFALGESEGDLIFADGFETGNTSAWSSVVGEEP